VSRRRYQVRYTGRAWADLEGLPFTARPALLAERATLRELIVPFGSTGYVILFSVEHREVSVLRMRHQRESGSP
jgi:hypothetical protein